MKLKYTKKILRAFVKKSPFTLITAKGYTVLTQYKEFDVLFHKNSNQIDVDKPVRKKPRHRRSQISKNNQIRIVWKNPPKP